MVKRVKPPSWREILKFRREVLARFPDDRFLRTVFDGCLRVGRDKGNPLRGNFVASGLREAAGHVLHSLAPDDEVRRCVWFKQAEDTPTVTRRQRASYIVRAGLPDNFVEGALAIDVSAYTKPLIDAIDGLHKATHVRPDTILTKGTKIREMFHEVLLGIDHLMDASSDSRDAVKQAVADAMHDAVFENLISETIQELDEISTHTTVDGHSIDTVEVLKLNATEIDYRVTGQVEVELQYGSNSDIANDIGYHIDDSYPYVATVSCKAAEPMNIKADDIRLAVDNSSFYE